MIQNITIHAELNGFTCRVGCTTVVFTSVKALLKNLEDYLKDSVGTEKRFLKSSINSGQTISAANILMPCPPTPPACEPSAGGQNTISTPTIGASMAQNTGSSVIGH